MDSKLSTDNGKRCNWSTVDLHRIINSLNDVKAQKYVTLKARSIASLLVMVACLYNTRKTYIILSRLDDDAYDYIISHYNVF